MTASLGSLRNQTLAYLGARASDPFYKNDDGTSRIDALLNDAMRSLHHDIAFSNPAYLIISETLVPGGTPHQYSRPVHLYRLLNIRLTDEDGEELPEVSYEDLPKTSGNAYALERISIIHTSDSVPATANLYVTYVYSPDDMVADADYPGLMPGGYCDILALMAAQAAYSFGGEKRIPPYLVALAEDRKAQLMQYVSGVTRQMQTTRGNPGEIDYPL